MQYQFIVYPPEGPKLSPEELYREQTMKSQQKAKENQKK